MAPTRWVPIGFVDVVVVVVVPMVSCPFPHTTPLAGRRSQREASQPSVLHQWTLFAMRIDTRTPGSFESESESQSQFELRSREETQKQENNYIRRMTTTTTITTAIITIGPMLEMKLKPNNRNFQVGTTL